MYYGDRIYIYKKDLGATSLKRVENSCPHEASGVRGLFFFPAIRSWREAPGANQDLFLTLLLLRIVTP